jgi:hypothetical protein
VWYCDSNALNLKGIILFSVIDDENPTVYTAGALVTVTVTLVRHNMSVLFGDENATDKHEQQDASNLIKGEEEEEDIKKETVVNIQMPVTDFNCMDVRLG